MAPTITDIEKLEFQIVDTLAKALPASKSSAFEQIIGRFARLETQDAGGLVRTAEIARRRELGAVSKGFGGCQAGP